MGAQGAEVATQVADIVLQHDDLSKILVALKEGRTVRQDIQKAVNYILTQNLAEIFFTFFSLLLNVGELLSPMQILWMNLVTDIFPELALAQEPPEGDILKRPPPLFSATAGQEAEQLGMTRSRLGKMVFDSTWIASSGILGAVYAQVKGGSAGGRSGDYSRTLSFLSLVTSSLFYALSCRSDRSILLSEVQTQRGNRLLPLSIALGVLMETVGVLAPGARKILQNTPIGGGDLVGVAGTSLIPLLMAELGKGVGGVRGTS
jgi:Ca2+-transporting ATPase